MAWYENTPLGKAVDESLLPPTLNPKNPVFELQKTYGELAQKIGLNNKDPQPQDIDQAITIMANDPASKDFMPTINTAYNQLDPDTKAQLDNQAKGQGIDPRMLLARNQLQTYFRKEPLDLNKAIDDSMPTGDVRTTGYSKEDLGGVTRYGKSKTDTLSDDKAIKHATAQLVLQPQLYKAIVDGGGQNPDGTPISNEKQAAAWLAEVYKTRYKTVKENESGISREGKGAEGMGEEEAKKDSDLWYSLLMRTENADTQKYYQQIQKKFGFSLEEAKTWAQKQAASFAKGAKTPKGEIVSDVAVILPGDQQTVRIPNPLTGESADITFQDPVVRFDVGQKGKESRKSIKDGQEVTEQIDVFNKTGEEAISTNPNTDLHRKKSDMDTYWKQGVGTRGKRFEQLFQESIEDTPETVIKGVTAADEDVLGTSQKQGIIPVKTKTTTTKEKPKF